jgi:uncharacterized Zn finger protein
MDELLVKCPACRKSQRHTILRFKEKNLAIAKCSKCGALHYVKPEKKESGLMLMISKGGVVQKACKKFAKNKSLRKGEIVEYKKVRYEIRSIEDTEGGHAEKLKASDARNIYLVPYTKKLSVSVHEADGTTKAYTTEKPKDEKISLGDKIKLEKRKVEITRISSLNGDVKKAKVTDILALTGRPLAKV